MFKNATDSVVPTYGNVAKLIIIIANYLFEIFGTKTNWKSSLTPHTK